VVLCLNAVLAWIRKSGRGQRPSVQEAWA
jgi:hypothetical protein